MRAPDPNPLPPGAAVVAWRTGALGDFVLTLPVFDALRDRAGHLTVIAPSRYRPLFSRAHRWIDAEGAAATALIAGTSRLDAHLGLAWTPTAADALRAAGIHEVWAGTAHPPEGVHQVDHLWAPIAGLLGPRDRDPVVPIGPVGAFAAHGGAVVIAPGSGGARKRRPVGWWREVAGQIQRPVVWVAGPLEAEEPGWGTPRLDVLDVLALTALASVCHAWVGPDAGPQHLAAAAGARVGAVFVGASDPRSWAPCGARVFGAEAPPAEVARWADLG